MSKKDWILIGLGALIGAILGWHGIIVSNWLFWEVMLSVCAMTLVARHMPE